MWCVIHSELMITGCHCSVDERRGQRKVYSNQGCCGKLLVPVAYRSMYFDFLLLPLARGDKHNAHALGARIAFFSFPTRLPRADAVSECELYLRFVSLHTSLLLSRDEIEPQGHF